MHFDICYLIRCQNDPKLLLDKLTINQRLHNSRKSGIKKMLDLPISSSSTVAIFVSLNLPSRNFGILLFSTKTRPPAIASCFWLPTNWAPSLARRCRTRKDITSPWCRYLLKAQPTWLIDVCTASAWPWSNWSFIRAFNLRPWKEPNGFFNYLNQLDLLLAYSELAEQFYCICGPFSSDTFLYSGGKLDSVP